MKKILIATLFCFFLVGTALAGLIEEAEKSQFLPLGKVQILEIISNNYKKVGNFSEASKALENAIRIAKTEGITSQMARLLYTKARLTATLGDYAKAVSELDEAIASTGIKNRKSSYLQLKARYLRNLGNEKASQAAYLESITLLPNKYIYAERGLNAISVDVVGEDAYYSTFESLASFYNSPKFAKQRKTNTKMSDFVDFLNSVIAERKAKSVTPVIESVIE